MGGVEFNAYRARACWNLQKELAVVKYYSLIAKMSQFFQGDAYEVFKSQLGTDEPNSHLRLLYWFQHGWCINDVIKVVTYVNQFLYNLEFIICDIPADKLKDKCKFEGNIIKSSAFVARLSRSTTTRTLYLHEVKMPQHGMVAKCSYKEAKFLDGFLAPHLRAKEEIYKYDFEANAARHARSKPQLHEHLGEKITRAMHRAVQHGKIIKHSKRPIEKQCNGALIGHNPTDESIPKKDNAPIKVRKYKSFVSVFGANVTMIYLGLIR
jgi:hypothetical protein